jgi:hypothetical protein
MKLVAAFTAVAADAATAVETQRKRELAPEPLRAPPER